MTERNSLVQEVGAALRDHGITAAITALTGGTIALLASVARKAFTNDAMLSRLDRELLAERDRVDRQRADNTSQGLVGLLSEESLALVPVLPQLVGAELKKGQGRGLGGDRVDHQLDE